MTKPKYTFDTKRFLIGAVFLVVGGILAYWQYQQWFNPQNMGGFSVRRASVMGIILTFFLILGGFYLIFIAFKGGAQTTIIFLPKEKWEDLKRALQTLEKRDFEKLLEGEINPTPQEEYAALTIERFKNQPGLATVQASKQLLNHTGGYYDTKNLTRVIPVEGAIVDILESIENKYKNPTMIKDQL